MADSNPTAPEVVPAATPKAPAEKPTPKKSSKKDDPRGKLVNRAGVKMWIKE